MTWRRPAEGRRTGRGGGASGAMSGASDPAAPLTTESDHTTNASQTTSAIQTTTASTVVRTPLPAQSGSGLISTCRHLEDQVRSLTKRVGRPAFRPTTTGGSHGLAELTHR